MHYAKQLILKLLVNKRAVRLLLVYLQNTEVDKKEGALEIIREWRRKSDQEREKQLGSF